MCMAGVYARTHTPIWPSSSVTLPPGRPQDCLCPQHFPMCWNILCLRPSSKLRARASATACCQERQHCGLEAKPAPAVAHVPGHQPRRGSVAPDLPCPASPLQHPAPPQGEARAHRSGCWRMRPRWPQRETVPWGTHPRSVCGHLQSLVPPKPPCLGQTALAPPTHSTPQTSFLSCEPKHRLSSGGSTRWDSSLCNPLAHPGAPTQESPIQEPHLLQGQA